MYMPSFRDPPGVEKKNSENEKPLDFSKQLFAVKMRREGNYYLRSKNSKEQSRL